MLYNIDFKEAWTNKKITIIIDDKWSINKFISILENQININFEQHKKYIYLSLAGQYDNGSRPEDAKRIKFDSIDNNEPITKLFGKLDNIAFYIYFEDTLID